MKQTRSFLQEHLIACIRVEGCNAVGLVQVAARTGSCEIVQLRLSTTVSFPKHLPGILWYDSGLEA